MILRAAAFVAGAWWLQQQALLPDLTGALAMVPLALLAWRLARRAPAVSACIVVSGCAVAGFFWAAAVASWKLQPALDEGWEGRDIELRGVVAQMTQPFDRGVRFRLDVEQVYTLGAQVPPHVALAWYRDRNASSGPSLRAGERWRMVVRLRRPHGTSNPGGGDFEAWMLERDLRAMGYVATQQAPRLLAARVPAPRYEVERLRESIRDKLRQALGDRPYAGVIVALAVGDQQAIPPAQWQVFTRTGVNHLMSISGLHITMVASMAFVLVMWLWKRSPRLATRLPALRAAAVAGLACAAGYAALAGFAIPAQRTVCMLAVVAWALWLGWTVRPLTVLAMAAAVATFADPMAVISPGFWLSFGAVAVIMLAAGGRIGRVGWLRAWVRAQWAVTIALVPLLLALFQQVSLVSPLANAIAIPIVSFVVVPLALLGAILPGNWVAIAAHQAMSVCMVALEALHALPEAVWQQHAPPAWAVPVAVLGALWMLLPRGFPARWVGAGLLLPLFLSVPAAPRPGELWVTVLDVGQGLAVVARTHRHALLFDAGPAYPDEADAGDRIVVPYLRSSGIARLDAVFVSHDDADHSGGALSVLRGVPVGWVASPLPETHPIAVAATSSRRCEDGQGWEWDGVRFEVLHPEGAGYNDGRRKDNDRSCVLRIVSAHGSILLPADIERFGEQSLVRRHGGAMAADVLVVPHHGSRTSSSVGFVDAAKPRLAIFTVGYRNRFGHPHAMVLARYRKQGTALVRTDVAGAVLLRFAPEGLSWRGWRETERRYWRGR